MKRYAVIAALVALVAFGSAAFAQDKPAEKPKIAAPAAPAPMARMKDALQLTPEQQAKLQEFQKARQAENQAFGDQMKKLREEMQALRQADKPESAKMNGLIDQIFKLQAERAKAGIKNAQEREKIFTPEQLEKMKNGRMGMRGPGQGMAPGMGMGMRMQPGMGMRMGMQPGGYAARHADAHAARRDDARPHGYADGFGHAPRDEHADGHAPRHDDERPHGPGHPQGRPHGHPPRHDDARPHGHAEGSPARTEALTP